MEEYKARTMSTISIPDQEDQTVLTGFSPLALFMVNLTSVTTEEYENYTSVWNNSVSEGGGGEFNGTELPRELMEMSENSKYTVIAYCILGTIALSGNLTILISVLKQYKKTKSRISLLILHLSIADLIVCCTLIPTEVFWRLTIQWRGGNILCKVMQFWRAFGLYLSSMVLICVSFDRFFAIIFPMKTLKRQGHQRIKVMLWIAWIASAAFSAPQAILFSIASHPEYPSFKQCVTNELLKSTENVKMYSIFSVSAMYFAPLVVILFTYTAILIKIIRKAHQHSQPVQQEEQQSTLNHHRNRPSIRFRMSIRNSSVIQPNTAEPATTTSNCSNSQHNHSRLSTKSQSKFHTDGNSGLEHGELFSEDGSITGSTCSTMNVTSLNNITISSRCSHLPPPSPDVVHLGRANSQRVVLRRSENAISTMSRAKNKTLVMTIVILVAFLISWTPYVVMTLWYMFDWEGAQEVDPRIQDGLFVMAVANSCVNPLIYGSFAKNCCGLSKIFTRMRRTRGQ